MSAYKTNRGTAPNEHTLTITSIEPRGVRAVLVNPVGPWVLVDRIYDTEEDALKHFADYKPTGA